MNKINCGFLYRTIESPPPRAGLAGRLRDAVTEGAKQPLNVGPLVRLGGGVRVPVAQVALALDLPRHRIGLGAITAHVAPPGDPVVGSVDVLAWLAAQFPVGATAAFLDEVHDVAARAAGL